MVKSKTKKVEKEKNKKLDIFLTVILIVLIVIAIALVMWRVIVGKPMDTNSDLVKELYDYFSTESLNNCEGLLNYTEGKIEYDDINSETRLCLAYQKSDIKDVEELTYKPEKKETICKTDGMTFRADEESKVCKVKKIKQDVIDKTYKKLFGKDIEKNEEFKADNSNICYLKDGYYYCGPSETFTITLGSEALIYRVPSEATQKGREVIVYDYFAKVSDNKCFKAYTTTNINQKCTDEYGKLKDKKEIDYKFLENYGTKYRHIYKKAKDGTYYWVSSELIEK